AAGDTGLADPPLRGLRVAVTREEEPGGPLASAVARRGARTLDWQAVRTVPPEHPAPLCAALERLAGYDWLVFTSARAVAAVAELVAAPVSGPRVAAVGRATAEAARAAGWEVD